MLKILGRSNFCKFCFQICLNHFRKIVSSMPHEQSYLEALKNNRVALKRKRHVGPASTAYLQFIGTGATGGSRALYLFTDYGRYLFNCGEGTQRLANEHKIKISKLEHVFVTAPIWENISGLPGLSLTVQECGVPELTLHGPYGTDSLFSFTSRFVILNSLTIRMAECSHDSVYDDPTITVQYVPLLCAESQDESSTDSESEEDDYAALMSEILPIRDDTDYYSYLNNKSKFKRKNVLPLAETEYIRKRSRCAMAMSYICHLKPKAGTLNLEACVEKGVPPGPLLGKLKAGEDITLSDGTIVKSKDVTYPSHIGPTFIVVDCPTIEFLESFVNAEPFKNHQIGAKDETMIADFVVHFSPSVVMEDERYKTWMDRFPEKTRHINANDKNQCMGFVGVHEIQHKLNVLDSKIFPLLSDKSVPTTGILIAPTVTDPEEIFKIGKKRTLGIEHNCKFLRESDLNIPENVIHTLKCFDLRPTKINDPSRPTCIYINPEQIINEMKALPNVMNQLNVLEEKLNSMQFGCSDVESYPKITFLGTGSSIPNKTRNTSGILVSHSEENHSILDCGEGTLGQLIRFFGLERACQILCQTRFIFVSHLHADHHIGLISLLKMRRSAVKKHNYGLKKVFLLAPRQITYYLCAFQRKYEDILDTFRLIPHHSTEFESVLRPMIESKLLKDLQLQEMITAKVDHCPNAYGISFVDSNGYRITYSGDTMPCENLVQIGRESDLLIHEATLEDGLEDEARYKLHSTVSQAIDIGHRMNARFILLTHFSQRYSKLPHIKHLGPNVGVAFDNMQVSKDDLKKLPLFYPVLKEIFAEHWQEMGLKMKKRQRKEEIFRFNDD